MNARMVRAWPTGTKNMKVTIAHADTCLRDYWSGHHLPHLQIPAYRMTFAELRRQLRDEIREGAVAGADDDTRLLSGNLVRPEEKKTRGHPDTQSLCRNQSRHPAGKERR